MKNAKQQVATNSDLQFCWYQLEEMGPMLLYDMLAVRQGIFVVEQSCIYQDLDGLDKSALHLLVRRNGEIVACLRLLTPDSQYESLRIGRVAVSVGSRSKGIARAMMCKAIEKAQQDFSTKAICLNAQTYLQEFYESLGFRVSGEPFLEDGIPHIHMKMV
jgi:ElaA protein